ncbi:MAG: hypothetical protein ACRCUY_02120 [Thermoguttaceae bacterium]
MNADGVRERIPMPKQNPPNKCRRTKPANLRWRLAKSLRRLAKRNNPILMRSR